MGLEQEFLTHEITNFPLPVRWPTERIKARARETGKRAYRRAYRMEAMAERDSFFGHFWKAKQVGLGVGLEVINKAWDCYTGVDISSATRPGNVIFTHALSSIGMRYPIDIKRGDWKAPELNQKIWETYERYTPRVIFVENNGVQQMVVDWALQKNRTIPVVGFHTGNQKADPERGLPSLDVEFENEAWCVPMKLVEGHDIDCLCPWCVWIKEVENYPQHATFDTVMAMWFSREASLYKVKTVGTW